MNAEALIVNKVREILGPEVSIQWYPHTNALVMKYPTFRFTIVSWYAWNRYMQGSNYDEYANHIADSFSEAILLKEVYGKLVMKERSNEIKEA